MNKIIDRIKSFFNIFIKNDTKLLDNKQIESVESDDKNFKENLEIKKNNEALNLQRLYDKGELCEHDLTSVQLIELIRLYEQQIKDLNYEINIKKSKLNNF